MKYINHTFYWLVGCVALLCASCNSQVNDIDGMEKAYITLSEELVSFTRESGKKVIIVNTDAKSWVATSPAEGKWLSVEKKEDALILSAAKNDTGTQRETYVLLNAGDASTVLNIRQSAGESVLEISETDLSVISNGGTYKLNVTGTDADWTLEGAEMFPWITVKKTAEGNIDLVVLPNRETAAREAKIYVRTSDVTKEIVIKQQGLSDFLLPYMLECGKTRQDMMKFENLRGTTFVGSKEEKGAWTYSFLGNDKYSSSISYLYPFGTDVYSQCVITTPNTKFGLDPAFEQHLFSLGFVKDSKKIDKFEKGIHTKYYALVNKRVEISAAVQISESGNWTEVVYSASEGQGGEFPTFTTLPLRNTSFFNKANYFTVKAWEESEGYSIETYRAYGDKNANVIYFAEYLPISQEVSTRLATIYFFEQEKEKTMGLLFQKTDFFTNISAGMWQTAQGRYKLTEEFKNLLVSSGFEFQYESQDLTSITYARYEDGVVLTVKVYPKYEDYNDKKPVLGLAYFGLDDKISSAVKNSTFMERIEFFKSYAQKAEANYKKWCQAKAKK